MAFCVHCLVVVRARDREMARACVHCEWVQVEWDESELTAEQCEAQAAASEAAHRRFCRQAA